MTTQQKKLGPSPAAKDNPSHKIDIKPVLGTWTVIAGQTELARSSSVQALEENNYPIVLYFPANDVNTGLMQGSSSSTHCPFKGDAMYYAFDIDGETVDVCWSYPETYDEVVAIAGHIAFYTDRVTVSGSIAPHPTVQ